jgi:protein O-mannosyl-transferase
MTSGRRTAASPAVSSERFSGWAIAPALALILLAAVAAYHNSLAAPFVLDDAGWINENLSIRHLWPIWPVLFPPDAAAFGGRPVVSLTLAINRALGGANVWDFHATNLAIHVLTAWLLFGVVRRTLMLPCLRHKFGSAATPLALVATILWTIHPLQTEAVTYVIQRTEALVGLFYLLVLYCVVRGATANRPTPWYLAATLASVLGMATKEVMVTAPVVVLFYDRAFLAGSFGEAWRRRYGLYLALAATWAVVAALLISTGFHGGTTGFAVRKFTCWSYLLTQPGVIVHYLWLTLWPAGLCLDYNWPAARTLGEVVWPGILVVGLLGLTAWALVKRPKWGYCGVWFFAILAPTSSFVPIQDAAFEHRMYLPLAAVVTGAVVSVFLAGQNLVRRQAVSLQAAAIAGGGLAVAVGIALGIATFQRNADYRDEMSICEDTVAKAPNNARALCNLGCVLAGNGRSDEAFTLFEKAAKVEPDYAEAHCNIGPGLVHLGRVDEAIAHYRKAIELKPRFAAAYYNLGLVLADRGQHDEAISLYNKALEAKPAFAEAHTGLGMALADCGRLDEAITQFRAALEWRPDDPAARDNLADAVRARVKLHQDNSPDRNANR